MTHAELMELVYLARRDARSRLVKCIGKARYDSRGAAGKALSRRVKGARGHAYRCMFCGRWHVGTTIAKGGYGRGAAADRKDAGHGGHI